MTKIKTWALNQLHKTVNRFKSVVYYLVRLNFNILVTFAVMVPLGVITEFVMKKMGYSMTPPIVGVDPFRDMDLVTACASMFMVGLWEETFFRYMLADCFLHRFLNWGWWMAAITAAGIFGYAHLANLGFPYSMPQVIAAFGAGIWFARVYQKEGLHMAILTHGFYNFAVVVLTRYLS